MVTTILLVIAGAFAALIVVGLFIPRSYKFSKTIMVRADKKSIFNTLDDLNTWKEWSQWSPARDPGITLKFSDSTQGVNSWMEWKGKKMGAGKLEITATNPYTSIQVAAGFNKGLFKMDFLFSLEDMKQDMVAVKWTVSGKTKRGGFAKILGRMLPRMMGKDMEIAMKILKHLCEGTLNTTENN